ncbi:MAG: phosphate transport system regulatory protein PhoU [Bacteriovorax sp. MedPE-SWde]|nr:MAG: phosphate transport system regulatory protein PhoU [Bacteriovorax sp. MedPE-SWde]
MPKHLGNALKSLKNNLLTLMEYTETTVEMAVEALENKDQAKANEVFNSDDEIDEMEVAIEEECLQILALHQPVAIDLRFIITALKVNNDLERIGDLAVNISERALALSKMDDHESPFNFTIMAAKTKEMLKNAIDSLMSKDTALAKKVCQDDDEVDTINREVYQIIYEGVKTHPERIEFYLQYLSCSRHLERIADYATNIAEDVIYMVEGEIVRHSPDLYKD